MQVAAIADLNDCPEASVSGRVIRTFEAKGSFYSTVLDDSGKVKICSDEQQRVGSLVTATGKVSKHGTSLEMEAREVVLLSEGQEELARRIDAFVESRCRPVEAPMLIQDGITKSLQHLVLECAVRLLRASFLFRPIVARYHGDADGIAGALALSRAITSRGGRFVSSQNPQTVYEVPDAIRDINLVRSFGESTLGPLAVMVDSGSGEESADAIGLLKGAGFEVVLIDHHPLSAQVSENADCILSPMLVGATSYYTAGLLAGEVARAIGGPDPSELQRISLAGDKSGLVVLDQECKKKALALDYLGKYSKFQSNLEFYESVLSNEKMLASVQDQARQKLEKAVRLARESLKVKELRNGVRLCTVNLDKAFKPGSFPGKGILCGALHDQVASEMKGPIVTVGYSGRLVSMRANAEARERGFDANEMINQIKRELINSIESGGGHDVAASVHVSEGFENIVLEEVFRHIGSI